MSKEGAKDFMSRQREIMETETPFRRKCIARSAILFSVLSFGVSLFWLIRADSANTLDEDANIELSGVEIDTHVFDYCAGFLGVSVEDLLDVCGVDQCSYTESDIDTNWHTIFEYNGVVMIFLTVSYAIVAIGACFVYARVLGAVCSTFWNCCNVIALMVTPAYRFSKIG